MLYFLYTHFDINIFQYISIRAGFAFFISLCFTMTLMPFFIKWAQKKCQVQPINEYVPQSHQSKCSTPTMGGIIFIISSIIASLLTIRLDNSYALGGILVLILFMLIGFKDDYSKIKKGSNLAGLSSRAKFILQLISAVIVSAYLIFYAEGCTDLYLPFMKNPIFDMGYYSIIFWSFILVGVSNAVNLTDGLDGLATVPSIIALLTLSVFVYITGHAIFSAYLLMPNLPIGEVTIVASALIGSLIAFLWFNCHPAEVFMGDSGSLTLGAFIAYMGIIAKSEVLLILIGLIFVIETVSVILQVGSYKLRKKRIFLMAPIHHHFEMKQWAENKIIVRFWIIAVLSNLLSLVTLKIR